jgi:hypothetical protein
MRRSICIIVLSFAAIAAVLAQRQRSAGDPQYELKAVFPRETSPAQFQQVDQRDLQALADQGWELVSVMPYIYKNEERGSLALAPRPMVTQTYPAYFFKRLKPGR